MQYEVLMATVKRPDRLTPVLRLCSELFDDNQCRAIRRDIDNLVANNDMSQHVQRQVLYHTYHHIFAMILRADELAQKRAMSLDDRCKLFIAILYHDYEHSFGRYSDTLNVSKSIRMFDRAFCRILFSDEFITDVCDMIFCTVFPFRVEPRNELECIIRDCDLTMSLEEDRELFAAGLTSEFANGGKKIIVHGFDMYNFAQSQTFYTPEIAELFRNKITVCMD